MKKFLPLFIFITLCLSISISADEIKCKKFDVKCKTKKFIEETKDFQKKGFEEGKKQIKDLNPLKK